MFKRLSTICLAVASLAPVTLIRAEVQWMWAADDRHSANAALFVRTFDLPTLPSATAEIRAIGDFCAMRIEVNGVLVAETEPYDAPISVGVKRWLQPGDNRLAIRARGVEGPSAVAFELAFVNEADKRRSVVVVSDSKWENAEAIAPLASLHLSASPLKEIGALDEYNQWKEAKSSEASAIPAPQFSGLPDGFKLRRLRVAQESEDSWVSMAFDQKGRLIVAKEKRGLMRFVLGEDGDVRSVETINDSLLECRGLLVAADSLYANANNSKALYRLRDTNGDDHYDDVQQLMPTGGSVGHGRNDLALGPDNRIYSIHGDAVKLPQEIRRLTPELEGTLREEGYLIRCDLDGNQRELVAVGLRNPYGIAFNRDGEPFTYDADNEGDIGLPLYRPTRLNHLISGANYGWRQANGESWPVDHPASLPSTLDIGRGSPTAVAFAYESHFPQRYRESLFILDWAYGRIIAVDVIPHGASYHCQAHLFVRGRPLNVTDLAFGADGAMYFITGGRGTQSALFRIHYDGKPDRERVFTVQEQARITHSESARERRLQLEQFHGNVVGGAVERLWPDLSNPDPWIRHAARVALEHQPTDAWSQRALDEGNLTALLALIRSAPPPSIEAVLDKVRKQGFAELSRSEKLTSLGIHEIALQNSRDPKLVSATKSFLSPFFPERDASVNRQLSKLLIGLGDQSSVPRALAQLARADSQSERLHYLEVLSRANKGWPPDGRRAFFSALRHRDYFRGDSNMPSFLKHIHDRSVASLTPEERERLSEIIEAPIKEQAAPLPEPRDVVQHWKITDFVTPPGNGFEADPARGREVFHEALCNRCHQFGSMGSAVGPNLTAVAQRFNRRDLIEAIIAPSRAVAEIFRPIVIEKKDGSIVVGRVVRDDIRKSTISLAANPFAPDELTVVAKKDIRKHQVAPHSPMPPGLLDTFSKEEVFQLLAFLEGAGSR